MVLFYLCTCFQSKGTKTKPMQKLVKYVQAHSQDLMQLNTLCTKQSDFSCAFVQYVFVFKYPSLYSCATGSHCFKLSACNLNMYYVFVDDLIKFVIEGEIGSEVLFLMGGSGLDQYLLSKIAKTILKLLLIARLNTPPPTQLFLLNLGLFCRYLSLLLDIFFFPEKLQF